MASKLLPIRLRTFCPECGPNVYIDNEGCCLNCGATASGVGVKTLVAVLAEKEMIIDFAEQQILAFEKLLAEKDIEIERFRAERERR